MKVYTVINKKESYVEEFHSLAAAKKAMRENNATGYIMNVRANGDAEPCGEITLKGTNKTFLANTRQTKAGY